MATATLGASGATPSPGTTGGGAQMVDAKALMAIRNLEIRARVVVEGFWNGIHRSPYHGFSVEFTEYRQYTPGDDVRYLDWRLYARSDRFYIKKFEDETNLRCHLIVDNSRSMAFGTRGYTKAEYANTLAATLAYFLYLQGDGVGVMTFDETIREYLPARHRTGQLRHLMLALEKPARGSGTDLEAPLRRIVEMVKRRGLLVLVTDLLSPIHSLEKNLMTLTARGHEVVVFQILDPAETNFNFEKASLFEDIESGRDLYIEPAEAKKGYLTKFAAHNEEVGRICGKLGIAWHRLVTDQPLENGLFDFLRGRMKSGKKSRHAAQTASGS